MNITKNAVEELKPFSNEATSLKIGSTYQHYKGQKYKVLSIGRHSETCEEMVIYESLYGEHDVWVRPLSLFVGSVEIDGKAHARFKAMF